MADPSVVDAQDPAEEPAVGAAPTNDGNGADDTRGGGTPAPISESSASAGTSVRDALNTLRTAAGSRIDWSEHDGVNEAFRVVETALADHKPWLEDELDECDKRADRAEARAVAAEAERDEIKRAAAPFADPRVITQRHHVEALRAVLAGEEPT